MDKHHIQERVEILLVASYHGKVEKVPAVLSAWPYIDFTFPQGIRNLFQLITNRVEWEKEQSWMQ